jgi:hypothetical protein
MDIKSLEREIELLREIVELKTKMLEFDKDRPYYPTYPSYPTYPNYPYPPITYPYVTYYTGTPTNINLGAVSSGYSI